MTALLTSKSDKVEKISPIINECRRLGITVSPPNVNLSGEEFKCIPEENKILFGLLGVKGMGKSTASKIIEQAPYKNFKDFITKVQDKTAIIALIKAGAMPGDKNKLLKKYADSLFDKKPYKPVSTVPSPYVKLLEYGLDVNDYKTGRTVDKERLLKDYNQKKEQIYNETLQKKYNKHLEDFYEKYCKDEYMWEFETLSAFITKDPLEKSNKYITLGWDDIPEDSKGVVCCVITDIKRKKDKNGNQFAYLDLYSSYGMIEATIWSSQLKEYSDIVEKGRCVSILGRKREGGHLFVEEMKSYEQWLEDRRIKTGY